MRFASVCSGIEAPSVAWKSLGWEPAWFSEVGKFPSAVLNHHYPEVPNLGDMTAIGDRWREYGPIDFLFGGTPCQAFSRAGNRGGMADPRGQLTREFLRLVGRIRPRWIGMENVPGIRSADEGEAFRQVIGILGRLGYGLAWASLDAQHFGLAQRRERVFIVGYLGALAPAGAVLFDRESLSGHPSSRRPPWKNASDNAENGARGGGDDVARTLTTRCRGGRRDASTDTFVAHTLRGGGFDASEDGTGRGAPLISVSPPVTTQFRGAFDNGFGSGSPLVADTLRAYHRNGQDAPLAPIPFDTTQITHRENRSDPQPGDLAPSLARQGHPPAIIMQSVRRLTPRECERLQGFPDDYTRIPWRGRPPENCPDGPRYESIGNSIPVHVLTWIGKRVRAVQNEVREKVTSC